MSFFSEYKEVTALLKTKPTLVFYSENRFYHQYFEPLFSRLLAENLGGICYISSDKNDPLLSEPPPGVKVIYVKWMLGFLFSRIRARIMIMTMPDLGNYLFKRSKGVDCYIYMFHAAVSSHLQYREKAFFHYDAVFTAGTYHDREIRATEKKYDLPAKTLVPYGYPLFRSISEKSGDHQRKNPVILIAPSWYPGCILDNCIMELLLQLSKLPYQVVLRLHPEYRKRKKQEYGKLLKVLEQYPNMRFDEESSVTESLIRSQLLITDRSGIALEFAFGKKARVLFIDTEPKILNPNWKDLELVPLEDQLREIIGMVISPSELENIPAKINQLIAENNASIPGLDELGRATFYNYLNDGSEGMEFIRKKLVED